MAQIMIDCPDPNNPDVDGILKQVVEKGCTINYFRDAEELQLSGKADSRRGASRLMAKQSGESPAAVETKIRRGEMKVRQGDADTPGEKSTLCTECREKEVYLHPKTGKPVSRKSVSYGLCDTCKHRGEYGRKWEKECAERIEGRMAGLNRELRYARPHLGKDGLNKHRDCFLEALILRDTLLELFPLEDAGSTSDEAQPTEKEVSEVKVIKTATG